MSQQKQPCGTCGRKVAPRKQCGDHGWECSHVDRPNRRRITAGPSDDLARDIDFNLTSHAPPKEDQ